MKRCFSRYRLALFALSIVSSTAVIAEQFWKGTLTCNIVDEDLIIKDDVLLPLGGTTIEAINRDITIKLSHDVTIGGHWAGESQLYLIAAAGRTISFELDHNLTFTGSSNSTGVPLLVVQSGPGLVEVAISEGKKFKITASDNPSYSSGGVQWYVLMYGGVDAPLDEYCDEYGQFPMPCCDEYSSHAYITEEYCNEEYCSPGSGVCETDSMRPRLNFVPKRSCRPAVKNRKVIIGAQSQLSFLSSRKVDIAQDSAFIQFDGSTDGVARMILEVKDTGAFVTTGHYTCKRSGSCITLKNINCAIAAGFQAVWSVFNCLGEDSAASLLVLDENKTLSELLIDPFLNLGARNDVVGYRGTFSGCAQYGVILGANGVLSIQSQSYLDFVGLDLNQLPQVVIPGLENININKLLKVRNSSALIIDGNNNPNSTPATIEFGQQSALFFRSGIANNGEIRGLFDIDPFTIDPDNRTCGFGNIVLDVEGPLVVQGSPVGDSPLTVSSKIELLSLEVLPSGGSLFVGSGETIFPLRTFNTEDNQLLMYNSGAFLINNMVSLFNTALSHTDESHLIFSDNDLRSEPAYIGGETFKLLDSLVRPNISFFNSDFLINTSVALTGLDLVVPNLVIDGVALDNLADFIFYANGVCIDNGTGRQMILGTRIGSTAADGCSRIDGEAYLDVMERYNSVVSGFNPLNPNGNQTLILTTAANDASINGSTIPVLNDSVHTIFLGDSSNISVGVNANSTGFNIDTNPWLRIQGNVFSFETRPGAVKRSLTTGKDAIFVDLNGKFSIDPGYFVDIDVMVIESHNGIVDLPADQVFFSDSAGIAIWNVDLSTPEGQIIVGPDEDISTFIFNWMLAKKNCPNFVPFSCCVDSCQCPPVTEANVTGLPTIQGTVNDLQIQATRIGDPAQFLIDGGTVNHLTFLSNNCSAEAPVATIVLENDGTIGLDGGMVLGANGITIIANGSGTVNVNGDLVVSNTCSIVAGPDFGACEVLRLYSAVPHQILVQSGGTLNLTSFTMANQIVEIAGELSLVMEPGSRIVTGSGTLRFADEAKLLFVASQKAFDYFNAIPFGTINNTLPVVLTGVPAANAHNELSVLTGFGAGLHNTDPFRVILAGKGIIEFRDSSQGQLPFNAFVGVENIISDTCMIGTTDLTLRIRDNGTFEIGYLNNTEGGVFQVGNLDNLGEAATVSFTLELNGTDASFSIGSRGFLGLGVGIQRFDALNQNPPVPIDICDLTFEANNNIVSNLNNVDTITFNFFEGRFEHDRIFSGDDPDASLVAVGDLTGIQFNLNFPTPDENTDETLERISVFNMAGGGNFVLVENGVGGIQPVVLAQDGLITSRLSSSIMASTLLQLDNVDVAGLNGPAFFDYFKTHDATLEVDRINTLGRGDAASQGDSYRPGHQNILVGAVSLGAILRTPTFDIVGVGQDDGKRSNAVDVAAVFVNIDPVLNTIVSVTNIEG